MKQLLLELGIETETAPIYEDSKVALKVTPRKDREPWCTWGSWAGGSPGLVNSTAGEGARKGELIKMNLTLTSLQEQAHRIAVLHEGTNLSLPAAAPSDLKQPEEGTEGRVVGGGNGEPGDPPYRLLEWRLVTQNARGQQEYPQQPEAQEAQHAGSSHHVPPASLTSLRGPSARSNRATVLKGMEPPPDYHSPSTGALPSPCEKMAFRCGEVPGTGHNNGTLCDK